jgi:hypothetical protein
MPWVREILKEDLLEIAKGCHIEIYTTENSQHIHFVYSQTQRIQVMHAYGTNIIAWEERGVDSGGIWSSRITIRANERTFVECRPMETGSSMVIANMVLVLTYAGDPSIRKRLEDLLPHLNESSRQFVKTLAKALLGPSDKTKEE